MHRNKRGAWLQLFTRSPHWQGAEAVMALPC
jgi:hypothetical protein